MSAYLISTPKNPEFEGKLFGLRFANGKAVLTEETLDPNLGWSVGDVLRNIKLDFPGYKIRNLSAKALKVLEQELEDDNGDEENIEETQDLQGEKPKAGRRGKVSKAS